MHYLLDKNKEPYPVTIKEAIKLYKNPEMKIVKQDTIDDVFISTVFLGMDHSWSNKPGHKPVLWETMIFGGEYSEYQERYTSHHDALEGHQKAIDLVNKKIIQDDGNYSN
jgi:hypothetical protein